jgi:glycosyltransferase involved in cell wall biosynthesis
MRPQIAVNTRLLLPNKLEGIGWFTYETLKRIVIAHPEVDFHFIFDREYSEEFIFADNVTPHVLYPSARHPILFYTWFEWRIPALLRKIKADLFISPDGYMSLRSRKKQLAVIHDINFEHYPQHLPLAARYYLKYYFPKFAKKAHRIATVSQFSKKDIVAQYEVEANKIDVVYNGASDAFTPITLTKKQEQQNTYADGHPYFIYVGALQPRKNIPLLLKAFDEFKKKHQLPHKLLLSGEKKWWSNEQEDAFTEMTYSTDVRFLGRLSQEKLASALAGAEALTYISFFEGFGIPLVEAMRCHTPIITSGVTSMPEVAGDAAVYCSPFDVDSIVKAMEEVIEPEKRTALIETGKARKNLFSWDITAESFWKSIELCLKD